MELELVYNEETQEREQKPEPFIAIECETEEDFEFIGTAVAFYKKHLEEQEKPQTNADRIRAMSDEELTDAIYRLIHANDPALWFCKGTKECGELMDNDEEIPEEMCRKCLLEKLQQPAEEG